MLFKFLFTGLCAAGLVLGATEGAPAGERPPSIIPEPYETAPNAVTRPAGKPDRDWRGTRRTPEVRMTAPAARRAPPPEAPRYDARGRRLNVPGRPDTDDIFGKVNRDLRRPAPSFSTPAVRTDAGSRINQLAPRR